MDRRRFAPRAEGLEERKVMSTASTALVSVPAANLLEKTARISRLSNLLDSLAPGTVVPQYLVTPLQADLTAVVGKLANPGSPVLNTVNLQFRGTLKHASITALDSAGLNATFGNALAAAGTPLAVTTQFQADMTNLLNYDTSHSTNSTPAILGVNDYGTVLQLALAVGRPIHTPAAPTLLAADSVGGKGGRTTYKSEPSLVGKYDAGATIQVLDEQGTVIGSVEVPSTGLYQVPITVPLAVGTHMLRVQALDVNGDHSEPSPAFRLVVKAAPVKAAAVPAASLPKGPLSL